MRERFDDFAWENDRVAHRMYGQALETWQNEPLTSSGVDVWVKRTPRLVVNDWYMADDYHRDHGEGADFYSAGPSRGCGGSGIWNDGQLFVSRNFRRSRVLANGPIRLIFELDYEAWDAGGRSLTERKRVTLDAGAHLNRFESSYSLYGKADLTWAAGIKKPAAAQLRVEREQGWMRTWEPIRDGNGNLGCAVLLDPAHVVEAAEAGGNALLVGRWPASGPAVYHAGSAWDRGPDVEDAGRLGPLPRGVVAAVAIADPRGRRAPLNPAPGGPPSMQNRPFVDRVRFEHMTTDELRQSFLVEELFAPGEVRLVHWEAERTILGSAVPSSGSLRLEAPDAIKAAFFNERRELGVVNVGAPGSVTVDGKAHELGPRDVLYVGRGAREVAFSSASADPAGALLPGQPPGPRHPSHAPRDPRGGADGAAGIARRTPPRACCAATSTRGAPPAASS